MATFQPRVRLDPLRLRFSWTAPVIDRGADIDIILGRAEQWLASQRAEVEALPNSPGLSFHPRWFAGATWLATIADGRLDLTQNPDGPRVSASGLLYPLLGWPLLAFLFVPIPGALAIYLFLVTSNGMFTWFKLRRLAQVAAGAAS